MKMQIMSTGFMVKQFHNEFLSEAQISGQFWHPRHPYQQGSVMQCQNLHSTFMESSAKVVTGSFA
jgi:hypothetical protein